jgi:hypothetical protein
MKKLSKAKGDQATWWALSEVRKGKASGGLILIASIHPTWSSSLKFFLQFTTQAHVSAVPKSNQTTFLNSNFLSLTQNTTHNLTLDRTYLDTPPQLESKRESKKTTSLVNKEIWSQTSLQRTMINSNFTRSHPLKEDSKVLLRGSLVPSL